MCSALCRLLLNQGIEENKEERGEKEEKKGWRCVYLHRTVKRWTSSLMKLGCFCLCCFHFLVGLEGQPQFLEVPAAAVS